jgi:hypothetical protein
VPEIIWLLERVDRDTEPLGGFGRAQLLDVAQQHHLAMERIEIAERSRQQLDALTERDRVVRVDDLSKQVFAYPWRPGRLAMALEQTKTLAPHDREQPARDR